MSGTCWIVCVCVCGAGIPFIYQTFHLWTIAAHSESENKNSGGRYSNLKYLKQDGVYVCWIMSMDEDFEFTFVFNLADQTSPRY